MLSLTGISVAPYKESAARRWSRHAVYTSAYSSRPTYCARDNDCSHAIFLFNLTSTYCSCRIGFFDPAPSHMCELDISETSEYNMCLSLALLIISTHSGDIVP